MIRHKTAKVQIGNLQPAICHLPSAICHLPLSGGVAFDLPVHGQFTLITANEATADDGPLSSVISPPSSSLPASSRCAESGNPEMSDFNFQLSALDEELPLSQKLAAGTKT